MTMYANGKPEPIVEQLIELLPAGSEILDLGCGEGRNSLPLARRGMNVVGWDKCSKEIGILNRKADQESLRIQTVHCDMRDLRIGYDKWQAVLTILCLHFLRPDEAKERLQRIRSTILPGGYQAMVVFTKYGALAKLRDDRFYPSVDELLESYSGWEIVARDTGWSTCKQNSPQGQMLENEYISVLTRKPL
ncbi:methyltransferase domain-containing protein [Candidatus Uhrbacteria bacterium]|nr:methyltransferase domain-containing protein [Candidatus Uhrbacteria bacterium]